MAYSMKKQASSETHILGNSVLRFSTLGAGNEVGRSCFVLEYKNKRLMLDCGAHPAYEKHDARPYFEHLGDMSKIDTVLISHFHVDHVGSLPYLMQHTDFNGRVFMTHPTKAISNMILTDSIKITHDGVWNESDLRSTMKKVETMHYHQEISHKGMRFWSYNAGHVLGAAMFMIEVGGIKILYTGDYSRQEDRHLKEAELPAFFPDILIVESTYGIQDQEPRKDREFRLMDKIVRTIKGGGRVLLPIFALGRAQELLLIIDEFWKGHPDLQKVPVYFATSLGKKCMTVYQTYVDMMVDSIQKRMASENPFNFQFIRDLRSVDDLNDRHPCIVLSSPGMLQSGLSRDIFDRWCTDERNSVIMAGYTVENTLAHEILKEPPNVILKNGKIVPLKLAVHSVSFSAHVGYSQNMEFIGALNPPHIILVHGARAEMKNLRLKIEEKYKGQNVKVWSPENNTTIEIPFQKDINCRVVGRIVERHCDTDSAESEQMDVDQNNDSAEPDTQYNSDNNERTEPSTAMDTDVPTEDAEGLDVAEKDSNIVSINGVFILQDFDQILVDLRDLHYFSNLTTTVILQTMKLELHSVKFKDIKQYLSQMFDFVEGPFNYEDHPALSCGSLLIISTGDNEVTLKWNSTLNDDMIADSIIGLLAHIQINPNAFMDRSATNDLSGAQPSLPPNDKQDDLCRIASFLENHFSHVEVVKENFEIVVQVDEKKSVFNFSSNVISGKDEALNLRLNRLMTNIFSALFPSSRQEPKFTVVTVL
ncbi:uncharacterized protein LOC126304695 [Schistocerca gregaria]|uniref:uncharacterized protein LOC126304695 n=1 Tax=Schistocerca gregaria TaxID=7010 RepID=UPI00211E8452|nr:uncharacterized protein LOC126304695 [Schistocerca gregaria]